MIYKWNYEALTTQQKEQRDDLAKKLGISPVLCQLLIQRGISSAEDAYKFFHPNLKDLHDPFLLPDMDKAIKRIEKALGQKQRILIYGDYDVDGTTAVALVYKFLRKFTTNLDYYIPDRYDEGYGISEQGIDYAEETGVKLIIALDCGIKAIEKVAYAKSKGIDFIIGDHHMPDEILPDAVAVIDAKRTDSTYPYEHLSGCGVGFKLVQALAQNNKIDFSELTDLLDLVAVSVASDIVPITGENRVLTYFGLKQINSNPSLGLKGIIEICGLTYKGITVNDIIFKIGPRINASGRMMKGKEAVDLLLANTIEDAREKSANIDHYNDDRRELDKRITDEAIQFIDGTVDMSKKKSLVIYDETWHKGVIGIVASRLTEKYLRPAVVLTKSQGLITGSARSVMGFDVYKAIEACKDILENFGGHTYAAGLSLKEENLAEFQRRFEALSLEMIAPEMMRPQICIDAELSFKEITPKFISDLAGFAPFGPENLNPIFVTWDVQDYGTSKPVGKDNVHLKLEMIDKTTTIPVNGIAFRQSANSEMVKNGRPFDICYTLEENTHNGKTNIQLYVKDIDTGQLSDSH
ncbi:MAG: single-stranded-DNA-specific exonuclease RecJ [Dysgonomonas sp.]|jgi:single-stranded-DNA-specific exonuclease|uniref:single-stranded-DNA-specific exonuclease RecJ n=1 Tax=unclassified Dysgonomonas TaxID=2630389 RepID=UPI0025C62D1F|nr:MULTISPECIES: single-stranded-DNA-specific exonuclease RecJ [unclassified Dysgonomonas]MDR2003294.1 single-stranded-DNA-specific exonuclease RecJ [Prevotella sp.]HMM04474.1 single-stranded-DNA-specific exonuclease RecJ [Dysgonomonas sp.]